MTRRNFMPARIGLVIGALVSLSACGPDGDSGSPSASRYDAVPPARVTPALGDTAIPEVTIPLVPIQNVAASSRLATTAPAPTKNGLSPISTVDAIQALGGRSVENPFKPGNRADLQLVAGMENRALPTGKWYKGFFYQNPGKLSDDFSVGRSTDLNTVHAFPNRLYVDDRIGMVQVSFPHRFYLDVGNPAALGNFVNRYIQDDYLFSLQTDVGPDVLLSHVEPSSGRLTRRIDRQDELAVSTSWNNGQTPASSSQSMQLITANGSPYVTVKYKNLRAIVGIGQGLRPQYPKDALNQITSDKGDGSKWEVDAAIIKSVAVDGNAPAEFLETGLQRKTPELSGKKFRFVYELPDRSLGVTKPASQRVMVVYASQNLTLSWDASSRAYTAKDPFTGVLRVALVDEQPAASAPSGMTVAYPTREQLLDQHANEYPVAGGVNLQYDGGGEASVRYSWQTETMSGMDGTGERLLMMAFDATHLKSMLAPTTVALGYRTNFGNMTGVVGGSWTQQLRIPQILRHTNDPMQKELWMGTGTIKAADRPTLVSWLKRDAEVARAYISHCNYESYACGKHIGNIARLALVADQVGEVATRDQMLDFLKQNLNPWFDGQDERDPQYQTKIQNGTRDYFQYDTVNRGVVTLRPFTQNNIEQDFFNAAYVDHMFHYGYFIYGAAVLARYDSGWRAKYKAPVDTLVRDIANASLDDKQFPITRTYDWFKMQNMADAGPDVHGGNTESSSEAINSGYAMVLWGAATGNGELQALAAIMAAGEIRTAQAFYQVTPENNVFADVAAATVAVQGGNGGRTNSLVIDPARVDAMGIKRQSMTQHATFFGAQRMFRVGIQLLPITPISEFVISPTWAKTHEVSLLQLEQDQTALFEDIFKWAPQDSQALCSKDLNLVTNLANPGGLCAGAARVLNGWRQIIVSGNGVNDPNEAWKRYVGYLNKFDAQTQAFAKLTVGTPFQRPGDTTKGEPSIVTDYFGPAGIELDLLKDISTPSNSTNVLWWLATRKP